MRRRDRALTVVCRRRKRVRTIHGSSGEKSCRPIRFANGVAIDAACRFARACSAKRVRSRGPTDIVERSSARRQRGRVSVATDAMPALRVAGRNPLLAIENYSFVGNAEFSIDRNPITNGGTSRAARDPPHVDVRGTTPRSVRLPDGSAALHDDNVNNVGGRCGVVHRRRRVRTDRLRRRRPRVRADRKRKSGPPPQGN